MTHTSGPSKAVKHPEAGYDIDHVATGHGIVTELGVEKEADAHLISAAPDLLEALIYMKKHTTDMDEEYGIELTEGEKEARSMAIKAIKKAMGGSQDG